MKFIKLSNGTYVDRNKLEHLSVRAFLGSIDVIGYISDRLFILKEFPYDPISEAGLLARAKAEEWLSEFAAELNGEESKCGL